MEIEEVYALEIWKKLERSNPVFTTKFHKILNNCCNTEIKKTLKFNYNNKGLTISYQTPIRDRELNCQSMSSTQYNFTLDNNGNLVINENTGTIRSQYGYDLKNNDNVVLDTHYSCFVYDPDGIELDYQSYNDQYTSYILKKDFFFDVSSKFNPHLERNIIKKDHMDLPKPSEIGTNSRYTRKSRTSDNLSIVETTVCQYDEKGKIEDNKEELYFNSFLTKEYIKPDTISVLSGYPFATIEKNYNLKINKLFQDLGLNNKNYKNIARERFLKELKEERNNVINQDELYKYDLMIGRIEKELRIKNRTR